MTTTNLMIELDLFYKYKKKIPLYKKGRITKKELSELSVFIFLCAYFKFKGNKADYLDNISYLASCFQNLFDRPSDVSSHLKNIKKYVEKNKLLSHESMIHSVNDYRNLLTGKDYDYLNDLITNAYSNEQVPDLNK